jgi:DNA-directed RNA polymerase specialized sigma24 family protein
VLVSPNGGGFGPLPPQRSPLSRKNLLRLPFALLRTRPAEELRDPEDDPEPFPPLPALDPVTRLAIQTCLERLPPHLGEVVEVRYFSDLKLEQAARATGQALATVKRRLREAFDHLRECLADHLPPPHPPGKE